MYKVPNDWKLGNFMELSEDEKLKWLYNESTEAMEKAETKELPAVTSSDNGDVLTVVDGAWAKSTPTSELPAVTSSDNGDVLTVVEGSWAKATPSGGGGSENYYVDFIAAWSEQESGYVITSTETNQTIKAAALAGKNIVGRLTWPTGQVGMYSTGDEIITEGNDETYRFQFDFVDYSLSSLFDCYVFWVFRQGGRWQSQVTGYILTQPT